MNLKVDQLGNRSSGAERHEDQPYSTEEDTVPPLHEVQMGKSFGDDVVRASPSEVPNETIIAALQALLVLDKEGLKEKLKFCLEAVDRDETELKPLLGVFLSEWAEQNGFILVKDEDVFPLIREALTEFEEREEQGRLTQIFAAITGRDDILRERITNLARQFAARKDALELQAEELKQNNAELAVQGAGIISDASVKAEKILADARGEARGVTEKADEKLTEARNEAEKILADARLESARMIALAEQTVREAQQRLAILQTQTTEFLGANPSAIIAELALVNSDSERTEHVEREATLWSSQLTTQLRSREGHEAFIKKSG